MASLPEHWESDYDGNRWFFRYKPTGIIQYTFPKPGDEFPEFIDASAPPLDLPPEEKLVSQQQVKRKGTSDSTSAKSTDKQGDDVTSATLAKGEGGGFWFQPDFMYLGPGSYNDISPVDEKDEEQVGLGFGGKKGSETDVTQDGRSHISPETSAGTTPLPSNTQTAAATPVLGSVAEVAVELPTRRAAVGVVAELPSETTARCRDEIHPAPVELPGHGTTERNSGPASYNSAFDIAPVELSGASASRTTLPDVSEKRSASPASRNSRQSYQNPTAQAVLQAHRPSSVAAEPTGEKYQPYNPVRYVPPQNDSRRPSQPVVPPPSTGPRYGETSFHTAPTQGPADVPSFLRPPQPPPKRPLDDAPQGNQPPPPFQGNMAGTRVPSILQPARGRPNLPLQTSVASIASSSKQYEPYSPYRELQDDIDQAVKLLASGMGETEAASHRGSPLQHSSSQKQKPIPAENRGSSISRTNTLPLHMPSLPFMGGGPSAAQATRNSRPSPPPAPIAGASTPYHVVEAAPRTETDLSDYMKYATATPADSADVPKPLNLARNSIVYPAYSPPSEPVSTQRRESEDSQHASARQSFASDLGTRPSSTFSVVSDFSTISERPPAAHSHSYASSVSAHRSSVGSIEVPGEQPFYQNTVTPPPESHPQRPPLGTSYASAPSIYRGTAFGAPSVGVHRNPSTQSQASVTSTSSRQSHGSGMQRPSSRLSSLSGEAPDMPSKEQSFGHSTPAQNRPHSMAYGQMPVHYQANSQPMPPNAAHDGRQPPTFQQPGYHPSVPDPSRPNEHQYRQAHNQSTPVPDAQESAPRKSSTGQRPVSFAGQPMYFHPGQPGAPATQYQQNPGYQAGQVPTQGQGQRPSMAGPPPSEPWQNQHTSPPMQRPGSSHQPVMSFQSWMGPLPGLSVPPAQQMMPQQTARPVQPVQLQPGPRPQSTPAHQPLPSGGYSQAAPSGLQAPSSGVRGSSPSPGKERNRLVKQPKNSGDSPPRGNHPASQNNGGGRTKLQKGGGSVGSILQQMPASSTAQQQHYFTPSQPSNQVPLKPSPPTQPRVSSVPPPNLPPHSHNTRPVSYMAPQPAPAQRPVQTSAPQRPLSHQQPPNQTSLSQRAEQPQPQPHQQTSSTRPYSGPDSQRPGSRQQEPTRIPEQQWNQQQQPHPPQQPLSQRPHSGPDSQRPENRQQEPTRIPEQQWNQQQQPHPPQQPLSQHPHSGPDSKRPENRQQEPGKTSEQQWSQHQQPPRVPQNNSVTHAYSQSFSAPPPQTQQQQPVQQTPQIRPPQGYNMQPAAQGHTSPRREPPSQSGQQQVRTTKTQPPPLGLHGEGAQPGWGGQGQYGQPQYGQTPPAPLDTSKTLPLPKKAVASPVELPSSPIAVELSSVPASSSSQQPQSPPATVKPLQQEPPRQEPPRQQPQRQEAPRQEAPRQEAPRQEPPRQEPPRQQPRRQEAPRQEAPRQGPLRQEPLRREPPRQEPPLNQAPRQEPTRQEPPRQEPPRQELPRQEPPRQEPPRQEPPRQEPPRQEPQRREPPRQEPPRQELTRQGPAAPGPNQGTFAARNMGNENQSGGRRPSDDTTQRQKQVPVDRPPPPQVQKQAPPSSQHQPASRLPPRQAPVQTPEQQPVNPPRPLPSDKLPNQAARETIPAKNTQPPAPAKAPSPVPEPTPPAPAKAAEKKWGDTSGYDGSGWGDDDDFY
ncbi:hypothetical protein QBC39DRAFT_49291 [Podospora conica]|nr:hypothetical protein QBC39DRAFT_49291 [Schizothecium conicum]